MACGSVMAMFWRDMPGSAYEPERAGFVDLLERGWKGPATARVLRSVGTSLPRTRCGIGAGRCRGG
jgi:hypothetical protein